MRRRSRGCRSPVTCRGLPGTWISSGAGLRRWRGTGRLIICVRFATVYPDDATIRRLLAQRYGELTRMLESFRDKQERDVKIYVEPGPGGAADDSSRHSPRWALAVERAERIARALSGIAIKTQRRPAPVPLAGEARRLVVDGAYLLDSGRAQEFASIVETTAAAHAALRAELNGPWPPYSFADR